MPLAISLILAAAFCNFTDRSPRDGLAGFPRHLFTLPVNTYYLVTCLMLCTLVSIAGIYVAWVKFVYEPLGIQLQIRWPLTLIAAGVVLFQTIIWCLSGFRLARVIVLSVLISMLVGIGLLPSLWADTGGGDIEGRLTAALAGVTAVAYAATILTVGAQRRGGARGWELTGIVADVFARVVPEFRHEVKSADAALFWLEFRRSGLVLPAAVLLTLTLILGPILWITGRGPDETIRAAMFLLILPLILTLAVGKGMSKPDFWSLELSLSPFLTGRPVAGTQILTAKMKTAAASAVLAWTLLLTIAPLWMFATCDVGHLRGVWGQFQLVYSPFSQWTIPILLVAGVILMTWSLLVGSIWVGHCGRPGFFYASTSVSAASLIALLVLTVWWGDHPRSRGSFAAVWAPRIPWLLAGCFAIKLWLAAWLTWQARSRQLIDSRTILRYLGFWIVATGILIALAWQISPRVIWLRDTLFLAAFLVLPLARIAAAPLAIAWNRHR